MINADGSGEQHLTNGVRASWGPGTGSAPSAVWFTTAQTAGTSVPLVLTGGLFVPGGSAAGTVVYVYATPPGGSRDIIGQATTSADGTFTFSTTPVERGTWVYDVSLVNVFQGPASFSVAVDVSLRAVELTLTASDTVITYGDPETLTARFVSGPKNGDVSIIRIGPNGGETVARPGADRQRAGSRSTPRSSTPTLSSRATRQTAFAQAEDTVKVSVRVKVRLKTVHEFGSSGKYALYHWSSSCGSSAHTHCPTLKGEVEPAFPGTEVSFHVWYPDPTTRPGSNWGTRSS